MRSVTCLQIGSRAVPDRKTARCKLCADLMRLRVVDGVSHLFPSWFAPRPCSQHSLDLISLSLSLSLSLSVSRCMCSFCTVECVCSCLLLLPPFVARSAAFASPKQRVGLPKMGRSASRSRSRRKRSRTSEFFFVFFRGAGGGGGGRGRASCLWWGLGWGHCVFGI